MSAKKKTYSADFKAKVVLELLSEGSTLNHVASKYEITQQSLLAWKKQFLENASQAFESSKMSSEYKREIQELQATNDKLAKALGNTTIERDWAVKKLESLDLLSKKSLIDIQAQDLSLSKQCRLVGISRTSLYYRPKPISDLNLRILNAMDEIYTDNPDYGYRYIHKQLIEDGFAVGKHRVLKYMKILGIEAVHPKAKKLTSVKDIEHKIYPYLLSGYHNDKKQVIVGKPNEVWSGDITYIRVNGGFMYLAAVIDWHSKAILSYKISNTMDAALATDVLEDAIAKYGVPKIFNSDQGSQYTSLGHTKLLKDNGIEISMMKRSEIPQQSEDTGKGRSIDNIAIERFFRTLKYSNIYISDYKSIFELKEGVKSYIHKYNFKRFHSALNYQKPMNVYLDGISKKVERVA